MVEIRDGAVWLRLGSTGPDAVAPAVDLAVVEAVRRGKGPGVHRVTFDDVVRSWPPDLELPSQRRLGEALRRVGGAPRRGSTDQRTRVYRIVVPE